MKTDSQHFTGARPGLKSSGNSNEGGLQCEARLGARSNHQHHHFSCSNQWWNPVRPTAAGTGGPKCRTNYWCVSVWCHGDPALPTDQQLAATCQAGTGHHRPSTTRTQAQKTGKHVHAAVGTRRTLGSSNTTRLMYCLMYCLLGMTRRGGWNGMDPAGLPPVVHKCDQCEDTSDCKQRELQSEGEV